MTYDKKSGMEPGITKRIMGHSLRSDVTEYYYTHPEFSDFENEIRKLSFDCMYNLSKQVEEKKPLLLEFLGGNVINNNGFIKRTIKRYSYDSTII